MIKVMQKRVNQGDGDCMQAVVASLFEMKLEDVPDFIREDNWWLTMDNFYKSKGDYEMVSINPQQGSWNENIKAIKHDGGIKGYFDATVASQTFEIGTHAVVVDSDLNIVHDPNPNKLALKLKPKDVLEVITVKKGWHFDVNGELVIEHCN